MRTTHQPQKRRTFATVNRACLADVLLCRRYPWCFGCPVFLPSLIMTDAPVPHVGRTVASLDETFRQRFAAGRCPFPLMFVVRGTEGQRLDLTLAAFYRA